MIIKDVYSKVCLDFFVKDIANLDISQLLYQNNPRKREFFVSTLKSLDFNSPELKKDAILSLLEKEFLLNQKSIEVEYKMLDIDNFMLILTDTTEKKQLEKRVNKEKKILKMIVGVVAIV